MARRERRPEATASDAGRPHTPVMLAEVLEALAPADGELFFDGTFGAGGYTRALLEAADCRVIATDRDPTAIAAGYDMVAAFKGRLTLVEDRFSNLSHVLDQLGVEAIDGAVFDVGVSSMQLDQAGRGFSFRNDGPLDMRMGGEGPSAAELVAELGEKEIAAILRTLGEERRAGAIARAIVAARETEPVTTTLRLADIVESVLGRSYDGVHAATRTFQALRIAVNDELGELARALFSAESRLKPGGRLCVVSFHSLEDRIVKTFLADRTRTLPGGSRHMPAAAVPPATFTALARGAVKPSAEETAVNPRARSAKLRAAVRTEAPARGGDAFAFGVPRVPLGGHEGGAS
ncbi:ribosomal RNA small subunit methyltransferase H [Methylopila jiangsuensis]|uniref:Ribosomal RNA small subunit methyltransferase H n=1 Tax=Methylopila jiangsuensis TaxID=586230 RepID=A0A9W6JFE0_9HYPH|nr:16S rRNA (cytosine(1402)-N(4))-methyltransferase RsmH [Methylopila jiangsuensis]MDR6286279.1 16S rRNA (cytosine1402-N4)-methyltransferase [Methylopila jiangsuensis]GLK76042.1 ribosomal RNA small subunit methyltransferase H [Methylopila jiangsuensis]